MDDTLAAKHREISEMGESAIKAGADDDKPNKTPPVARKRAQNKPVAAKKTARKTVRKESEKVAEGQVTEGRADVAEQGNPDHATQERQREPQGERRARGLRAVVSRTRRKGVQKREGGRPPQGQGGDHSQQGKRFGSNDRHICFDDVVSGRFDAAEELEDQARSKKRVLSPQPESPKLHKVLAQAGMGSRLEMEQLILEGRISVNSEPAHIGQRIQYGDQVRVNGRLIKVQVDPPVARVLIYHKPVGEVVTRDDPEDRPVVFRRLPRLTQGKWQSIGRLDINTEGLLLFTNSGDLANSLMHPRFAIEREYAVRVLGGLSNEDKRKLLDGVELDDGRAHFKSVVDGGGEGANQWCRVVITEGRNREVRRMIEACEKTVSRLIRIRYGAVALPAGLKRGHWSELAEDEMQELGKLLGGKAQAVINAGKSDPAIRGERKGKGGRNQSSVGKNNRDRAKNNDRSSRNQNQSQQPDPMKTSLGYIQHEAIMPPVSGRGQGRAGGSNTGARRRTSNAGRRTRNNF